MSLPSAEAFARLFRELEAAERAAFVAELWAARGWQTTMAEGSILATRDGNEQRIRVVDPGRFGTPGLSEADVLVSARDRATVERAVEEAGSRYVSPVDLYQRLLYGLDRETAARLFAEFFDQPLDAPGPHVRPPLRERLRRRIATRRRAVRNALGTAGVGVPLLLVVLLVAAVVAGPALTPNEADASSATETPTTTAAAGAVGAVGGQSGSGTDARNQDRFPPGLGESGLTDLSALLGAHERAVASRERTLRVAARGPPNTTFMAGRVAWNYTVRIEEPYHYRYEAAYTYPPGRFSENTTGVEMVRIDVFANAGSNYRRRIDPVGTSYQRYPTDAAGEATKFTGEVTRYLRYFLGDASATVNCMTPGDAAAGIRTDSCRVVVTEPPPALSNAESFRALAVVQGNGLVSSLGVSYTVPDRDGDGTREEVRFGFGYAAFDSTTVTEPDWLATAKNETG